VDGHRARSGGRACCLVCETVRRLRQVCWVAAAVEPHRRRRPSRRQTPQLRSGWPPSLLVRCCIPSNTRRPGQPRGTDRRAHTAPRITDCNRLRCKCNTSFGGTGVASAASAAASSAVWRPSGEALTAAKRLEAKPVTKPAERLPLKRRLKRPRSGRALRALRRRRLSAASLGSRRCTLAGQRLCVHHVNPASARRLQAGAKS